MPGRIEGGVAVVTGAASGIGRACALRFAEEGADVVVADVNDAGGRETLRGVEACGRRGLFIRTDVREEAACEAMAQAVVDEFGCITTLLAAAGGSGLPDPDGRSTVSGFADFEGGLIVNRAFSDWTNTIAVNLFGTFLSDRAVARRMLATGTAGSIINLASTAATIPMPAVSDYCVSKAGIAMLSKVLAQELGDSLIRVNAIAPGLTATAATAEFRSDAARLQRRLEQQAIKRIAEPGEMADLALFLAADESSFITGQLLHVDGGMFTG